MNSTLVNSTRLLEEKRWDFEFFDPIYEATIQKIKKSKLPIVLLGDIALQLTDGQHGYLEHTAEGIPLLRTSNIFENEIRLDDVRYIAPEVHAEIKRSQLKVGDVLLTTIGSIGLAAVVDESIGEANINQNLVKITPKAEVNPYYLSLFLNSSLGQIQIERTASKSVVPIVNYSRLRNILIPLPQRIIQDQIADLMQAAYLHQKNTLFEIEKLFLEIENTVRTELGLSLDTLSQQKLFTRPVSSLQRWDITYNLPQYLDLETAVSSGKHPCRPFGEVVEFSKDTLDPSKTPDDIFKYVEIGDVDAKFSEAISPQNIMGKDAPSRARKLVHTGEIVTGISGVLTGTKKQSTFVVPENLNGAIVSTGFAVLRPKQDVLPGYIQALLSSDFFLKMIWRRKTGAAIPAISGEEFQNIPTPIPPLEVQEKISVLLLRCYEKARLLSSDAKNKISNTKTHIEKLILGETEK